MATNNTTGGDDRGEVIEKFKPTSGRWVGAVALALAAYAIWSTLSSDDFDAGVAATVVGLAIAGLVAWVTLVRPTVRAYSDHLLIKNMLRDTEIPWHLIDDVEVRQTLRIYSGNDVHQAVGLGRSARQMIRADGVNRDRSRNQAGFGGLEETETRRTMEHESMTRMQYMDYVPMRLLQLRDFQKTVSRHRESVQRRWAPVETGLLLTLLVTFVVLVSVA